MSSTQASTLSAYFADQTRVTTLREEIVETNQVSSKEFERILSSGNLPTVQELQVTFEQTLSFLNTGEKYLREYERICFNKQDVIKQRYYSLMAQLRCLENMALIFSAHIRTRWDDPHMRGIYQRYSNYIFREGKDRLLEQYWQLRAEEKKQAYFLNTKRKSDLFRHLKAFVVDLSLAYDGRVLTAEEFVIKVSELCDLTFAIQQRLRVSQEERDGNRMRMAHMLSEFIFILRTYAGQEVANSMTERWIEQLGLSGEETTYFIHKGFKYYAKPVFLRERVLRDKYDAMQEITSEDLSLLLNELDMFANDLVPDKYGEAISLLLSLYRFLTDSLAKELRAAGLEARLNRIYTRLMDRFPPENKAAFSLRVEKGFYTHPAFVKAKELKNDKKVGITAGYEELIRTLTDLEELETSLNYEEMRLVWTDIASLHNHFAKEIANFAITAKVSDTQKLNYYHQAYSLLLWNSKMFLEYTKDQNKRSQLPHILNAYNYVNFYRLSSGIGRGPEGYTDDPTWYAAHQISLIKYGIKQAQEGNDPSEEAVIGDQLFKMWRSWIKAALQRYRAGDFHGAYACLQVAHGTYVDFKEVIDNKSKVDYDIRSKEQMDYRNETEHFLSVYENVLKKLNETNPSAFMDILRELLRKNDTTSLQLAGMFTSSYADVDLWGIELISA